MITVDFSLDRPTAVGIITVLELSATFDLLGCWTRARAALLELPPAKVGLH